MGPKHRQTLQAIFEDPVRSNIAWRDIEAMLKAAGAEITEGAGSRVRIALNGVRAVFHRQTKTVYVPAAISSTAHESSGQAPPSGKNAPS
jgi:hypothetical protein